MTLREKLEKIQPSGIGLCVGLDPVPEKLPDCFNNSREPLFEFNQAIIEATKDYASAYKPNLAFYEVFGAEGWIQLEKTIRLIPDDKLIILDGKRGDIGNTAKAYSRALFEKLGGDMATVNAYLGSDTLMPFIENPGHGVFVLTVTSNPGGAELQELSVDGKPLYIHVLNMAKSLNTAGNVGLVIGATRSSLWPEVIEAAVDMPLLVPGIGAQGGDIQALKTAVQHYQAPVFVNVSRSVIYASRGENFQSSAKEAAKKTLGELNS